MTCRFAIRTLAFGAALVLTVGSGLVQAKTGQQKTVNLKDSAGNDVGTATIVSKGSGVELKLQLKNLPPGEHVITLVATPEPPFPARFYAAWDATEIRLTERDGGRP